MIQNKNKTENVNMEESEVSQSQQPTTEQRLPIDSSYFPWLSILSSLVCVYVLASKLELGLPFSNIINGTMFHPTHIKGLLLVLLLVYVLEFFVFNRRANKIKSNFERLNNQISLSWKHKNKQQLRANTYSDHSNKLKSFISDRLIEFMEFDEKFIHFKGIASEVRHNGVISYDKVNSALNRAIEQQRFLAVYEQENELTPIENENNNNGQNIGYTENSIYDYQSAKDAITYLWDLLDLSTAENMSLYIGKKLVEYEENYFQTQLNASQHEDTSQTIGYHPTFHPLQALLMSMQLFTDSEEIKHFLINSKINTLLFKETFDFSDEQFKISTRTTNELLGNPNHIVLLLENLIKNAQFFKNKVVYKQKSDRIIIDLDPVRTDEKTEENVEEGVTFSIYNRGTIIAEEDIEQIFKLGYTTRKKKDANGRGLGLHFVKEIVNGYQGTIKAINIFNKEHHFKLLLGLASGEDFIYHIQCKMLNDRMVSGFVKAEVDRSNIESSPPEESGSEEKILVDSDKQPTFQNEIKVERDIPIERIQIINTETEELFSLEDIIISKKSQDWLDNRSPLPLWEISLSPYKKKQVFTFKALDISGVRFVVNIPSMIE